MTTITFNEVLSRLDDELVNAQAEGFAHERCRDILQQLEQRYHGDPGVSETRVMVQPGRWAYIRLRGNGNGDFRCELVRYEEVEQALDSPPESHP